MSFPNPLHTIPTEELDQALRGIPVFTPAPSKGEGDFLWEFLNQAIIVQDIAKVRHYLELGAPVRGWAYKEARNYLDIDNQRVESVVYRYNDKKPAPLALACRTSTLEIVKLLIESGAPTGHEQMPDEHNPFLSALQADRPDVLYEIIKNGAVFSYLDEVEISATPCWKAVEKRAPKVFRFLMSIPEYEGVAHETMHGCSLAHYAVRELGSLSYRFEDNIERMDRVKDMLSVMFEHGISPNTQDKYGETILHCVADRMDERDHPDELLNFCAWLIDHGCDPNVLNAKKEPFHHKLWSSYPEKKQEFLSKLEVQRLSHKTVQQHQKNTRTI